MNLRCSFSPLRCSVGGPRSAPGTLTDARWAPPCAESRQPALKPSLPLPICQLVLPKDELITGGTSPPRSPRKWQKAPEAKSLFARSSVHSLPPTVVRVLSRCHLRKMAPQEAGGQGPTALELLSGTGASNTHPAMKVTGRGRDPHKPRSQRDLGLKPGSVSCLAPHPGGGHFPSLGLSCLICKLRTLPAPSL